MLSRISPDSNWTLCVMNYDRWLGTRRLLSRSRCADRSGKINAVSRVLQNLAWCCVIMQIDNNRCFHVSCHNQQMGLIVVFLESYSISAMTESCVSVVLRNWTEAAWEDGSLLWSVWLTCFTPAWMKWSNQIRVGLNQTGQSGVNPKILCCSCYTLILQQDQ